MTRKSKSPTNSDCNDGKKWYHCNDCGYDFYAKPLLRYPNRCQHWCNVYKKTVSRTNDHKFKNCDINHNGGCIQSYDINKIDINKLIDTTKIKMREYNETQRQLKLDKITAKKSSKKKSKKNVNKSQDNNPKRQIKIERLVRKTIHESKIDSNDEKKTNEDGIDNKKHMRGFGDNKMNRKDEITNGNDGDMSSTPQVSVIDTSDTESDTESDSYNYTESKDELLCDYNSTTDNSSDITSNYYLKPINRNRKKRKRRLNSINEDESNDVSMNNKVKKRKISNEFENKCRDIMRNNGNKIICRDDTGILHRITLNKCINKMYFKGQANDNKMLNIINVK